MKKISLFMAAIALSFTAMGQTAKSDTVPAQYPGGPEAMAKYINSNLRYPKASADNGIEGVVNVKFTIFSDGKLGKIGIVRLADPDLEAEGIRLVKGMPAWIPAQYKGNAVESDTTVNILFQLPE